MPRLRLIQALTTGTDHIEALPNLPPGVMIAAARGFHGPQMSELAFIFMLHFVRDLRGLFATQDAHRWNRVHQRLLAGRTVVIVGVGAIAEELAKRCQVFGMRVIGVSAGRTTAPHFDAILPREQLTAAAARGGFPDRAGPAQRGDASPHRRRRARRHEAHRRADQHRARRRGGRGRADRARCGAGRIGGAGLDVFQTEPLPQDSPLWDLPNVFITSHVGGMSDTYGEQVLPRADRQPRRLRGRNAAERMRYIVRNRNNAKG